MRNFFLVALVFLLPSELRALSTSENALRIEDSRSGNLILGAEKASLAEGEMYHRIVLLWGRLEVSGELDQLIVLSGHVVFRRGSKLKEKLVVMGGSFESEPGADLRSERISMQAMSPAWRALRSAGGLWRSNVERLGRWIFILGWTLLLWLLALALFGLFPALRSALLDGLGTGWTRNLALGVAGGFGACIVLGGLVVSILGILLVPFYLLGLLLAGLLSYLAAAAWAGQRLLPPRPGWKLSPAGLFLGILAFQLLWASELWLAGLLLWGLWLAAWGQLLRGIRLLWR